MTLREKESWFRPVTRAAAHIRRRFGIPDRETETRILRVFRAALRPRMKPGRKPDNATVHAADMGTDGMDKFANDRPIQSPRLYQRSLWQGIYREVFPGLVHMDKLTRQYRTAALRRNVKAYLRRQGSQYSRGYSFQLRNVNARLQPVLLPGRHNELE